MQNKEFQLLLDDGNTQIDLEYLMRFFKIYKPNTKQ